jgi:RNA polymerase sigma-70 factor (ECF subfamily)
MLTKPIDPGELGQLLDEYASPLALYASQWTNGPEDCVQEAIVELAAQAIRPDNPVAWLFRVVRNRALNQSRSQRRQTAREKTAARPDVYQHEPSRRIEGDEERTKLLNTLESLNREDRELVVLRIWSGLSWQEIAEITATSSSTAQRRYVAALEKMKQRLETKCPTNPD